MEIRGWESAEVRTTHISVVLLGSERVLKLKKPLDLGFLDFRSLAEREAACRNEMALNERTAPGVTLGVRAITDGPDGLEVDGRGEVVDWAVEMQRLPDDRRLISVLQAGDLDIADIDRVAGWLAAFHGRAEEQPTYGGADTVARLVQENFDELPQADELLGAEEAEAARQWQRAALPSEVIEARRAEGRVRDGHGDLRLDHVYLLGERAAPRVVAIDGIEFDFAYRRLDVAADLGFLAMELELHGRHDLAERLVARWARDVGDWGVYRVLDGYVAYRAWVRAKVRMLQGDREACRARLGVAHALAKGRAGSGQARTRPVVVAVGGPIAAGKSTLAERLARALRAPVVDADRTRKQLAGVDVHTRLADAGEAFAGAYSEAATERVYEALATYADAVLGSGRPVILDASFRSEELRDHARQVAARHGVPVRFVTATAPREVLEARLAAREQGPAGPSDARAPLLDDFLARYTPPSGPDVRIVDTSAPLDEEALVAFVTR